MSTTTPNYYTPNMATLPIPQQLIHMHIQHDMPAYCREIYYATPEFRSNPRHYMKQYLDTIPNNIVGNGSVASFTRRILEPKSPEILHLTDFIDSKDIAKYRPTAQKRLLYVLQILLHTHILYSTLAATQRDRVILIDEGALLSLHGFIARAKHLLMDLQINSYCIPVVSEYVISCEMVKLQRKNHTVLYADLNFDGFLGPAHYLCHRLWGFRDDVWQQRPATTLNAYITTHYYAAPSATVDIVVQKIRQQAIQYVLRYNKPMTALRFDRIIHDIAAAYSLIPAIK